MTDDCTPGSCSGCKRDAWATWTVWMARLGMPMMVALADMPEAADCPAAAMFHLAKLAYALRANADILDHLMATIVPDADARATMITVATAAAPDPMDWLS